MAKSIGEKRLESGLQSLLAIAFVGLTSAAMRAQAEEPLCTGDDLATAMSAKADASKAIDKAIAAIDQPSTSDLDRLATWFGVHSSSDAAEVRDTLVKARSFSDGATFLCSTTTNAKLGDVYAYVRPDQSFAVVLGSYFFNAQGDGFNSKFGTVVHEITHFVLVGSTKDDAYGVNSAKALAASEPTKARRNADNYEYFVEATWSAQ